MILWSLKFSLTAAEYVDTERLSNYEQSHIECGLTANTKGWKQTPWESHKYPYLPVTKAVLLNPGQLLSWFLIESFKNVFLSLSHLPVVLSLAVFSQQICIQLILFWYTIVNEIKMSSPSEKLWSTKKMVKKYILI